MRRAKTGPNGKKTEKPKHGGRKIFFHRLWCRIQGIQILDLEDDVVVKVGRQKGAKNKKPVVPKRKLVSSKKRLKHPNGESLSDEADLDGADDITDDDDATMSDLDDYPVSMDMDGMTSEDEDGGEEKGKIEKKGKNMAAFRNPKPAMARDGVYGNNKGAGGDISSEDGTSGTAEVVLPYSYTEVNNMLDEGETWSGDSVRLATVDDCLWLSERDCFIRSEMVDVFSANYTRSTEPDNPSSLAPVEIGQVGIRCVHCEAASPHACPHAYACYPTKLASLYETVTNFHKEHFKACPNIPKEVKATFNSLKGFGAKAKEETKQYWIDSARELGLSDGPSTTSDGGTIICFHRNPHSPSPADDLAEGRLEVASEKEQKALLVREEDKGMVTDFSALLLRQVKRCRFKRSDRRGGPGSRGRDRAIGFAGLACIHCASRNNNIGRYFPLTAKHLANNTANSIM